MVRYGGSQYDFIDGFARHMRDALRHAPFVGFKGTVSQLPTTSVRAMPTPSRIRMPAVLPIELLPAGISRAALCEVGNGS